MSSWLPWEPINNQCQHDRKRTTDRYMSSRASRDSEVKASEFLEVETYIVRETIYIICRCVCVCVCVKRYAKRQITASLYKSCLLYIIAKL